MNQRKITLTAKEAWYAHFMFELVENHSPEEEDVWEKIYKAAEGQTRVTLTQDEATLVAIQFDNLEKVWDARTENRLWRKVGGAW